MKVNGTIETREMGELPSDSSLPVKEIPRP